MTTDAANEATQMKARNERPNIFPALRYQDAPAAIEWLVKAFGFEKLMVYPGENDTIAHAELKLGPGIIMLGSGTGARPQPTDDPHALNISLYVYVVDIDSHYQRAKAAGAEIVRELQETDYGSREYGARDLEGYAWGFGTYMPEAE